MKMKVLMIHVWSKLLSLSGNIKNLVVFSNRRPGDFHEHTFALLPDDIVEDIFARLPAESVLACKRVCSRWYHIISTKHFARVHLKRVNDVEVNLSMFKIYVGTLTYKRRVFSMKGHMTKGLKLERVDIIEPNLDSSIEELQLVTSCDGLVILKCGYHMTCEASYVICNPITKQVAPFVPPREFVKRAWDDEVTGQKRIQFNDIVGLFYDEIRSEYKIMQYCYEDEYVTYYVYGLRSKSEKILGTSKLNPSTDYWGTSVFAGRKLCWMVYYVFEAELRERCSECIMIFESESETLHCLPHPGSECNPMLGLPHQNFRLLVLDSNNLGVSISSPTKITIWVLQGSMNFTWSICHVINYQVGLRHFPVIKDDPQNAQVLNLVDGELYFRLSAKGFFTLNLCSKAIRKLKLPRHILRPYGFLRFKSILHFNSLVSPEHVFG